MESLTLQDHPPPPGGGAAAQQESLPASSRQPAPLPQLPPQMFTTAAQLLDLTDKKLMVALRDGRKLIGVLRSWDQFANLVLQSTTERIFAPRPSSTQGPSSASQDRSNHSQDYDEGRRSGPRGGLYADIHHGIFLVRGENVLLLGEIDLDKDDDPPPDYERADLEVVKKLAEENKAADSVREKSRLRKLAQLGFEGENMGEILL